MVLSTVVIMVRLHTEALKEFHRPRIQILLDQGVDLAAFETIPNHLEASSFDWTSGRRISEAEAYISLLSPRTSELSVMGLL